MICTLPFSESSLGTAYSIILNTYIYLIVNFREWEAFRILDIKVIISIPLQDRYDKVNSVAFPSKEKK